MQYDDGVPYGGVIHAVDPATHLVTVKFDVGDELEVPSPTAAALQLRQPPVDTPCGDCLLQL